MNDKPKQRRDFCGSEIAEDVLFTLLSVMVESFRVFEG